jgi:hypothetical protein
MSQASDQTSATPSGKPWGGRFAGATAELMERFNASIGFDYRLLEVDVAGSKVYARALVRAGLLTEDEGEQIISGLEQVRIDLSQPEHVFEPRIEDIHMAVETRLIELVGPVGGKLPQPDAFDTSNRFCCAVPGKTKLPLCRDTHTYSRHSPSCSRTMHCRCSGLCNVMSEDLQIRRAGRTECPWVPVLWLALRSPWTGNLWRESWAFHKSRPIVSMLSAIVIFCWKHWRRCPFS